MVISPQSKTFLTLVLCPLSLLPEKNNIYRTLPQRKSPFLSKRWFWDQLKCLQLKTLGQILPRASNLLEPRMLT